jgi:hypothetical protein
VSNRRPPIIERVYEADEESCIRAVEFLLKSVRKEGGPETAPNSAKGGSSDSSAKAKSSP